MLQKIGYYWFNMTEICRVHAYEYPKLGKEDSFLCDISKEFALDPERSSG